MENIRNDKELGKGGEVCTCACSRLRKNWLRRDELGIMILRVCVAGMVLLHGTPKLLMLVRGEGSTWLDPLGLGGTVSLILCVFAEFVCAVAVLLGLFTRWASLVLALNFWVIVFVYDADVRPMQAELPLLYLVCFVTLVCTGGGRWSLDGLMCPHHRCSIDLGHKHVDRKS